MTILCPACRKGNPVESNEPCVRCSCDLSRLREVKRSAARKLAQAGRSLRNRQWGDALAHSRSAWAYQHTAAAARSGFLAALAGNDPQLIRTWFRRVEGSETGPPPPQTGPA